MMDNELDKRLQLLEVEQKNLLAGQQYIFELLQDVAALLRQPDEEGEKLRDVLEQLVAVIGANTATLQDLKKAIMQKPEGQA
jgi:ABC-type transporter Mla subunit MlaD